jgi:hypothetical protein
MFVPVHNYTGMDDMTTSKRRSGRPRPAPQPDALAYTFNDACQVSGIGRTKMYELVAAGRLKATYAAGRRLILGDSLRALLSA